MSTIQVQTQLTFEQLVDAVKQLPRNKQKELASQINLWQSQPVRAPKRKANGKQTLTEADLLDRIRLNSSLPDAARHRFNRLRRKLQNETISETELTELQNLTSRAESMAVERLEALVELARVRKTNLNALMKELGLDKLGDVF